MCRFRAPRRFPRPHVGTSPPQVPRPARSRRRSVTAAAAIAATAIAATAIVLTDIMATVATTTAAGTAVTGIPITIVAAPALASTSASEVRDPDKYRRGLRASLYFARLTN